MKPLRRIFLFTLLFALTAAPAVRAQETAGARAPDAASWAHERSDLKPDPKVIWGKLENGLRYAILPNAEPPKRASVRLYIDAGSLMETEEQRGLAHFLEHMAFNGTTHYPANEMVEFFQRLGMAFGADTNAHTSFKETVYKLELPNASEELLDKGLLFMADVAGGMLIAEQELEKERGVILSEKLARDDVDFRTMVEGFKFSLPESLIPRRLPIGEEEVIKTAPRERFVEFYRKWYTPDRMVLVVVGDVDPALVKKVLTARLSPLKAPVKPLPDPDFGPVSTGHGLIAKLHTEKEAGQVTIGVDTSRPSRKRPDTAAARRENLVRYLADAIVNRRFEILAKKPDSPFLAAQVSYEDWMRYVESASLQMVCKPENWDKALAAGEREIRRAVEHGFTKAELEEVKANILTAYENNASTAPTRKSRDLADSLVRTLGEGEVFVHPEDALALVKEQLPGVTPEQCHELFRKDWATEDIRVFIGGNLTLEGDASAKIVKVFQDSRATPVEAPVEAESAAFAYTDFGPKGKVTSEKKVEDLDITQVVFENGTRLNIKPTEFRKDTIQFALLFGDGKLTLPKDKPGLDIFASATFEMGGLEKHGADDLKRLLAGRTVSFDFSVAEDAFLISARCNRKDLLLQCQLLAAWLSAPGYRDDGVARFRQSLPGMYQMLEHTAEGVLQTKVSAFTRGNDYRFVLPPEKELASRTMEEVKAWLEPALRNSYLEIGVVGDLDPKEVIDALAATVGALPARAAERPENPEARKLSFPAGVKEKEFPFTSKIPKSVVAVYWPTTDRRENIKLSRQLSLLAEILSDRVRVKVREELGESYSPDVRSLMSDVWPGYGQIAAMMIAEPRHAKTLGDIARELGAELAAKGATADELERARKPLMTALEEQRRNNVYWLTTVVAPSQSQPQRLEWARGMVDDFKNATLEDLNRLAKIYLKSDKATVVRVTAREEEETETKPAASTTRKK